MDPKQPHQHVDHNDVLQFGPRYSNRGARNTDELVAQIFHRTTGGGRSALLRRPDVEQLRDWLTRWLDEGWDNATHTCQDRYKDQHAEWECDQDPGHTTAHVGPAVGWHSDAGRPGRNYWANDQSRAS